METLTKKEEQIMQILWDLEKGFVKDILARLPDETPYNTVSSVVRILVKKEFVGFTQYGNTYEYFPIISKKEYRKRIFSGVLKNYFDNSYKKMVSFLAQEKDLDDEQAEQILRIIDESENTENDIQK